MAEPHLITALARKRAELSGDIENTQKSLKEMILALEHALSRNADLEPDRKYESG
jgi:hypothetical protein